MLLWRYVGVKVLHRSSPHKHDLTCTRVVSLALLFMSDYMTKAEAAEYLRCSPATVDRWIRDGHLNRYKVGPTQSVRLRSTEVKALIQKP